MKRLWGWLRRAGPVLGVVTSIAVVGWLVLGALAPKPTFVPGTAPVEWPTADGRGGTHYSELADITADNVEYLEVAWTYRTGDVSTHSEGVAGTAFEATPIMVDGVLYVATPFSRVIALNADTGEELWTYDPDIDKGDEYHMMLALRGVSYWKDDQRSPGDECAARILLGDFDARLHALDAKTGAFCSDFGGGHAVNLRHGVRQIEGREREYKHSAPPAIINDLVVVGSMLDDNKWTDAPSGVVRGFDVRTGELRWAWEPIVGIDDTLSNGHPVQVGAGNAWATITADAERDLLFVPTGSPSPDHFGGLRPGDNRYANSLVALRGSTGEVVWAYQIVRHDLWDYDLPSPPALITIRRNGQDVPAVVQTTKMGHVFVFHRETGEPLFPIEEVPAPASDVPGEFASPTQPVPTAPSILTPQAIGRDDVWGLTPFDRGACRRKLLQHRNDGVFTPPSLRGSILFPGFIGGMEWGGVGFDPESGLLVTNTNSLAMIATLIPRETADTMPPPAVGAKYNFGPQSGSPYAVRREPLLSPFSIPCTPPPWGMLHAVDMNTGEIEWQVPLGMMIDLVNIWTPPQWGSANMGGPLVTGGVVFIAATMDRRFRAFDLATGELLWIDKLPASSMTSPMTYRASDGGRQFVVISAGGHDGLRTSMSDHVVAYALPVSPSR